MTPQAPPAPALRVAEVKWLKDYVESNFEPGSREAATASLMERTYRGEPLQYVLGTWSFRMIELIVDPRVLIPRPETEVVVGVAIETIANLARPVVVDLGTGSGAIALSIATEVSGASVWATDVSADAIAVAALNLAASPDQTLGNRVTICEGAWFDALPRDLKGSLDLVVSNPPYIAEGEYATLPLQVREHEPKLALVAGATGIECFEEIMTGTLGWLRPGGALVVEIAPHQSEQLMELATAVGFIEVSVHQDLAGRDRVLSVRTAK